MENFELISESRVVEEAKKGQFTNSILTLYFSNRQMETEKLNFNRIIQKI